MFAAEFLSGNFSATHFPGRGAGSEHSLQSYICGSLFFARLNADSGPK